MEVSVHPLGEAVSVHVSGRLDNNWSNLFAQNLDQIVGDGARDLRVDMSDVNFISSAGIGVLVHCYNQLRAIQGSFIVVRASPRVASVLKQVRLEALLCAESTGARPGDGALPRREESAAADYEVYDIASAAALQCRCYGDPRPVFASAFAERECLSGLHLDWAHWGAISMIAASVSGNSSLSKPELHINPPKLQAHRII